MKPIESVETKVEVVKVKEESLHSRMEKMKQMMAKRGSEQKQVESADVEMEQVVKREPSPPA